MGVASSAVGREAGRGLLTLANLITAVAPVAADWNDSHIFNQRWPSHARFHGVVALAMTSSLASLNLWSLWSDSTDRRTSRHLSSRSRTHGTCRRAVVVLSSMTAPSR